MTRLDDLLELRRRVDAEIAAELRTQNTPKRTRRNAAECGTESGHKRHRRAGETPCDACKAAHSLANCEREARRRRAAAEQLSEAS